MWVLIVLASIYGRNAGVSFAHDFNTQQACEQAAEAIRKEDQLSAYKVVVCTPKG